MISSNFFQVASSSAKQVGVRIRQAMAERTFSVSIKGKDDFVTEIDIWSEELIRTEVQKNFPDHLVVGEESALSLEKESGSTLEQLCSRGYVWVVDPLDGTANFTRGIPIAAVSIGLLHNGQPILGVIYDPFREELFAAEKGRGAYCNERKISVSSTSTAADAFVTTGFPPAKDSLWHSYRMAHELLIENCCRVRIPGAAVIDLCWVACGRTDAFFQYHLKCWDVAAGSLIVNEAGGVSGSLTGRGDAPFSLFQEEYLFGNPKVYPALRDLAQEIVPVS